MNNSVQQLVLANLVNIINRSPLAELHKNPVWIAVCIFVAWEERPEDYPIVVKFLDAIIENVTNGLKGKGDTGVFKYSLTDKLMNQLTSLIHIGDLPGKYEEMDDIIKEHGEAIHGIPVFEEDGSVSVKFIQALSRLGY